MWMIIFSKGHALTQEIQVWMRHNSDIQTSWNAGQDNIFCQNVSFNIIGNIWYVCFNYNSKISNKMHGIYINFRFKYEYEIFY